MPPMSSRIRIAGTIWAASLLLSRLFGLVRERVLGSTLGAGGDADVYAAAFRIPDLFNYLLAGGALSIVFIPLFTAHIDRGDEERAWRSFSIIANFLLLVTGILVPALWIAMPVLAHWAAPGFSPHQTELLVRLSRIVLPAQAFHIVGGLLSASLLSRDRHLVPALSPLLYNIGIIAGGLLGRSAEGFAWGVLAGAFLGSFAVPLAAALSTGLRWSRGLSLRDPDFRAWILRSLPIMLGWSIVALDDPVLTWFGSHLGTGQVALLNYAKTLMKVPMVIFGAAMGYAAYPTLTRLSVSGRAGEAYRVLHSAARKVLLLAFGCEVLLTVAGPEFGTLIYTTRRIAPEKMDSLGLYLGLFSLGLAAWSAQILLARGFYARGKAWFPTWLGTGVLVLSLPLYWLLSRHLGAAGLCLASALAITVYAVLLELKLRSEIGEGPAYPAFLARGAGAAAVGIAAGLGVRHLLGAPDWSVVNALWRAGVLAISAGGAFAFTAALLRIRELGEVITGVGEAILRRRAVRRA
jgi:putative peptidoglycan lipid II flippase